MKLSVAKKLNAILWIQMQEIKYFRKNRTRKIVSKTEFDRVKDSVPRIWEIGFSFKEKVWMESS